MAVENPDILLVLNDSSGTVVTNDGSLANASVGQGAEGTDWSWNQGLGAHDGYWQSITNAGNSQAWISMIDLTRPGDLQDAWLAIGFSVTGWDTRANSQGYLYGTDNNASSGGWGVWVSAPTSTGDFDLTVKMRSLTSGFEVTYTYTDLSFSTDYQLAVRFDTSTVAACDLKAQLDSGAVQTSSSNNFAGLGFDTHYGYIGRFGGFTNYYGFSGKIDYLAVDFGTTLSDTDLADINNDPAGTITGWPSSGPAITPLAGRHLQNLMSN